MISNDPLFLTDQITTLDENEALVALLQGFRLVMNSEPSPECLATLFSQSVLETGHFRSMHRWNFGNVKRIADRPWTWFRCNEVVDGVVKWFDPPHRQTHFLAHYTARDGAADHLEFLACRDRYRDAWKAAYSGYPGAFSKALSKAGYYTADVEKYTAALVSIYKAALPAARAAVLPGEILSGYEREALSALCYVTAVESLRGSVRASIVA